MKDPRLLEIEILGQLDRESLSGSRERFFRANPSTGDDQAREEALLHLLFDGAVIEGDYQFSSYRSIPETNPNPTLPLMLAAQKAVDLFFARNAMHLRITQRGRLRLYRLRDEILNKDKLRDDFGILWAKRHWAPDRDVALLMHDFAAPFSMLLLDVDRLKDLNSAFLNTGADEILRGIFQFLRNTVPADTAYRLGGDEAGALLPGMSLDRAKAIAVEVCGSVHRAFADRKMPNGFTPTVSIGVGAATARLQGIEFENYVEELRAEAKKQRNIVIARGVS